MDEVVRIAESHAESGDTVLLAPACASMDQFENYADRGNKFADSVRRIIHGK
jgi:UDP-N-acetylmuramoylalanine--D-glutamate ligase